ncbi:MAG: ribosome small subunit-dependent GTPase A [Clostridia bacterium]
MKGIIIEIKPEKYIVETLEEKNIFSTSTTGNVKRKGKLLVGDYVNIEKNQDVYLIDNVYPRKNQLIRPPIANIDQMFCIISKTYPKPDLLVLDKQLISCEMYNITPIICINKSDDVVNINEEYAYIKDTYSKIGYTVLDISAKAKNGGLDGILKRLEGKVSALSGLSGVGKSSIIKKIFGDTVDDEDIEVGVLNDKINRGKHTTKYVKLYSVQNGYIADTPGFSSLELEVDIEKDSLKDMYIEYRKLNCKYKDCNHVIEDECKIKEDANCEQKYVDADRYARYVKLYTELLEKDRVKYKKKNKR